MIIIQIEISIVDESMYNQMIFAYSEKQGKHGSSATAWPLLTWKTKPDEILDILFDLR